MQMHMNGMLDSSTFFLFPYRIKSLDLVCMKELDKKVSKILQPCMCPSVFIVIHVHIHMPSMGRFSS